jgi:hypothetical protein
MVDARVGWTGKRKKKERERERERCPVFRDGT